MKTPNEFCSDDVRMICKMEWGDAVYFVASKTTWPMKRVRAFVLDCRHHMVQS